MSTWPNNAKVFGVEARRSGYQFALQQPGRAGQRLAPATVWPKTSSIPDGYAMHGTTVPPYTAGGLSSWQPGSLTLTGTGDLLQGGPVEGTASVASLTGTSGLSLVVSLSGTGVAASITGNGMVLALTIGLDGTGSWSLTAPASVLALIVPITGTGVVASMGVGSTDLRGRLSLAGEWTPFAALSPEGLAAAVWGSVLDAGYTAEQIMRLLASVEGGKLSGVAANTPTFRDLGDTKDRVTAITDSTGRTAVTLDLD